MSDSITISYLIEIIYLNSVYRFPLIVERMLKGVLDGSSEGYGKRDISKQRNIIMYEQKDILILLCIYMLSPHYFQRTRPIYKNCNIFQLYDTFYDATSILNSIISNNCPFNSSSLFFEIIFTNFINVWNITSCQRRF